MKDSRVMKDSTSFIVIYKSHILTKINVYLKITSKGMLKNLQI